MSVHQPGTFNIETLFGGAWRGGMNRLTREDAIETAKRWAAEAGRRYRVFDLDGQVIFDTGAMNAPVDVLAYLRREVEKGKFARPHIVAQRQAVLDAVAELIEAAAEVRAAHAALPSLDSHPDTRRSGEDRIGDAHYALNAALAGATGARS